MYKCHLSLRLLQWQYFFIFKLYSSNILIFKAVISPFHLVFLTISLLHGVYADFSPEAAFVSSFLVDTYLWTHCSYVQGPQPKEQKKSLFFDRHPHFKTYFLLVLSKHLQGIIIRIYSNIYIASSTLLNHLQFALQLHGWKYSLWSQQLAVLFQLHVVFFSAHCCHFSEVFSLLISPCFICVWICTHLVVCKMLLWPGFLPSSLTFPCFLMASFVFL